MTPSLIVPDSCLALGGLFRYECINKEGEVYAFGRAKNAITNAGLNDILNTHFRNGSTAAAWYTGLVNASGFSAFAAADTMSSHAGWTELTGYSESTRVAWSPPAASAAVLVNSSAMSFTITSVMTIYGLFIVSNSTKGGTSGTLWSTAAFDQSRLMAVGETFKVFYTLTASSGA